jgi:flagellar basal body rod protein FlgG
MSKISGTHSNLSSLKEAQALMLASAQRIAGNGVVFDKSSVSGLPVGTPVQDVLGQSHQALVGKTPPDILRSMTDMIVAQGSFEANVSAVKALHDMAQKSAEI